MVYADNSATSFPKPRSVIAEVKKGINDYFANAGRGSSRDSVRSSEILFGAREAVADLVGTVPENIVFTYNATYALNMAILGILREGMTVAYDKFAHNSVLRPIHALEKRGVRAVALDTHPTRDSVVISSLEELVKSTSVDLLVLTHTSNVTGKRLPIDRLARICKEHGVTLLVDGSQGIGCCDINMERSGIDILASSGHKGLYGIMGTGFLAVRREADVRLTPIITGGSGMFSLDKEMPPDLPERLEAGTLGLPGIISVKAGAEYLMRVGVEEIGYKEKRLRGILNEGLSSVRGVRVYNADVNANSIVLFNFKGISVAEASDMMDREDIILRSGYHCAPLAHSLISQDEGYEGALRLSVGYFNTVRDCQKILKAVNRIAKSNS